MAGQLVIIIMTSSIACDKVIDIQTCDAAAAAVRRWMVITMRKCKISCHYLPEQSRLMQTRQMNASSELLTTHLR